jgi:hypothetical protein
MTEETPDRWEVHPHMTRARGQLVGYRTPDHTAFVDVIYYKEHMEPEFRVELKEHIPNPGPDSVSFETELLEAVDAADEQEAKDAAYNLMDGWSE